MYSSHALTPDIERALERLSPSIADEIRAVYRDYDSLLTGANVDREAVLGFVDALGRRFDELPNDPEFARKTAERMVETEKFSAVRDALIEAEVAVKSGKDITEYVEEVLSNHRCPTSP